MSARMSLPQSLGGSATLTRSGEGVTIGSRPASVPPSATKSRTLSPSVGNAPLQSSPTEVRTAKAVVQTPEQKEWGYNFPATTIIWLMVVFVVVFLILWSSKMNFVTDLINGQRVINTGKVLLWTVVIGIIISVVLYAVMASLRK